MAFRHISGPAHTEPYLKLASTAIAVGAAVAIRRRGTDAGYLSQALITSTRIVGINIKLIQSTDGDWASNTAIPVLIPTPEDIFSADVSGTATQANVGARYDLTGGAAGTAQSVDLSGTTYGVVTVVGFVSASEVLVKFNSTLATADTITSQA